jgi:hypothetical protein
VEWTNASYIAPTKGSGVVLHICGEHVVVLNTVIARQFPHLSPYVSKRLAELRLCNAFATEVEMQMVA